MICAQHVVEEVADHAAEFAEQLRVDPHTFLTRWREEYMPVLRVIPDRSIPEAVLTQGELTRVRRLNESKDIPSVVLAMALGAFFLTKDEPAWEAVYDAKADPDELGRWLEAVRGGNTADELVKFGRAGVLLPALVLEGFVRLFASVRRHMPWAFAPLVAGLAYGASRVPSTRYESLGQGVGRAVDIYMAFRTRYQTAIEAFRPMEPSVPAWTEIAREVPRRSALLRACLAALARSPRSQLSAAELARQLPKLGVGQSAPLVREVLRSHQCFSEPYSGRWQVGAEVTDPT